MGGCWRLGRGLGPVWLGGTGLPTTRPHRLGCSPSHTSYILSLSVGVWLKTPAHVLNFSSGNRQLPGSASSLQVAMPPAAKTIDNMDEVIKHFDEAAELVTKIRNVFKHHKIFEGGFASDAKMKHMIEFCKDASLDMAVFKNIVLDLQRKSRKPASDDAEGEDITMTGAAGSSGQAVVSQASQAEVDCKTEADGKAKARAKPKENAAVTHKAAPRPPQSSPWSPPKSHPPFPAGSDDEPILIREVTSREYIVQGRGHGKFDEGRHVWANGSANALP